MLKVDWQDDFKVLYKKNGKHPYSVRLLALSKMQEGYCIQHIMPMVNKTAQTLLRWKRRYEEGGLEALLSMKAGRGRKSKVKAEASVVKEQILKMGADKKGGRVIGEEIRQMINKNYDTDYSLPGIYHLLHRLNLRWISVRSVHPKANHEEQEIFKKNSGKM